MPNSDYVSSGGGLKLKGVKDAGIKKSKKKKDKNNSVTTTNESVASQEKNAPQGHIDEDDTAEIATEKQPTTKTEAERKYDEMRRKRLADKLKRDGTKTHKERVEEFNKALSKLSEHHDMPRIGPG